MSSLINFQLDSGPDHKGRKISDIWRFNDFWLEHDHQYIQWLFPIDSQSKFNRHAPVLTPDDIKAFQSDPRLKAAQQHSLEIMLSFFGMEKIGNEIVPSSQLNIRDHIWLKHGGHNHLRISRIIRSLALCDQSELSGIFQSAMIDTARQYGEVTAKTVEFWKLANQVTSGSRN